MTYLSSCFRQLALLGLIVVVAAWPARSSAESQDAKDTIDLSLNLEPGQSYVLELLIDQTIDQDIPAMNQQMTMKQLIGMTMRYDVTDRASDAGGTWVTMTYEGIKFTMDGPMVLAEYDSADPPAEVPMMAKGMAALLGQSLEIEFLPTGKLAGIEGVAAMMDKMIDAFNLPEGPAKENMKAMMETQFNEDMMEQMIAATAGMYPGGPVAREDSWDESVTLGGMMPMQIDVDYTLNDFDPATATVGVSGKISPHPDAQPVMMGGMEMDAEFNGEHTGTVVMERATGFLISSEITQDMDGGMTMNLDNGNSLDIEMVVDSTVTMKRLDP